MQLCFYVVACFCLASTHAFVARFHHATRMTQVPAPSTVSSLHKVAGPVHMTELDAVLGNVGLNQKPKITFVGGKGGVGKTSSSSAIALASADRGQRTLVVSTDPAHSLGDALGLSLVPGQVTPVVTETYLWALELSLEEAMEQVRELSAGLSSSALSNALGVPKDMLDSLGLDDLTGLLSNPPPGIDEVVALARIFQFANERLDNGRPRFDHIVVDTAPTGHTLRLLELPALLDGLAGRLIRLRSKIQGAVDSFKALFGGGDPGQSSSNSISGVLGRLEELQANTQNMRTALKDEERTSFVVVSVPTQLAAAESERLVKSLRSGGIKVSGVVCNQVIAEDAGPKYLASRVRGQEAVLSSLRAANPTLELTRVPFVDTEVTGEYGLRYFADMAHAPVAQTATNPVDSRKLTIYGGKGGVGKTTTAASWAVRLSDAGMRTLVVSTDPAHSLGDALMQPLSGLPQRVCAGVDATGRPSGGELWALEVDPEAALADFRDAMQDVLRSEGGGGMGASMGLPDLKAELAELLDSGGLADTPGVDEVVALTTVMSYLEDGLTDAAGRTTSFDRIVLDTAPTGHTLRMLQQPAFMIELVAKVRTIRDRADAFGGGGGGGGGGSVGALDDLDLEGVLQGSAPKEDRLDRFERRMGRLQELLSEPKECEFAVVTIPTEVAAAETTRLVSTLRERGMLVRRLIVNQVLKQDNADEAAANAYLSRLRASQQMALGRLTTLASDAQVPLVTCPFFDTEVRTVFGLRLISNVLFTAKRS